MSFPPRFLNELRDRISVSSIVGKKVKLTKKGREYLGLCPFHHEKTASFTVNDEKGFYHCFGCGAHGDIIRFLTDCERLPFLEAVEHLAHLAGLSVPQSSPAYKEMENKQKTLIEIMELACQFFQKRLFETDGEKARNYLKKRGITSEVAKQFRLGYAPTGSALLSYLTEKNISLKDSISLGLIVENSIRKMKHDYFYDRIMFPILDKRKRVIGFGGRLMEKGEPKYLNSPETDLFHKGNQLYALPNALETIRKTNQAILVEGYMDVIALHSAGFTNAVAPLGTAFTESQLQLLWDECDEPIICFDGDKAGRNASARALSRALPILSPGKSLQFVFLPDSFDPDDMIRKKSPQAFQEAINGAKPFSYALWNMLLENRSIDTPERKAKLEKDTMELISKIKNNSIRTYYIREMRKKLLALNKVEKHKTKLSFNDAQTISKPQKDVLEGRMLLAYLIRYPQIAQNFIEDISLIKLNEHILQKIMDTVLGKIFENPNITSEQLQNEISLSFNELTIPELEMLQKSDKTFEDAYHDIASWIRINQIRMLKNACYEKSLEYEQNHDEHLWAEILSIKDELSKISADE